MTEATIRLLMPSDFQAGVCSTCPFAKGSDQCKLTALFTNNTCLLNCFCPFKRGAVDCTNLEVK